MIINTLMIAQLSLAIIAVAIMEVDTWRRRSKD